MAKDYSTGKITEENLYLLTAAPRKYVGLWSRSREGQTGLKKYPSSYAAIKLWRLLL